jgi:hypothetical protein
VLGFAADYFFIGGRNPSILLASGIVIGTGMATSGLTSAMLVEYTEMRREISARRHRGWRENRNSQTSRRQLFEHKQGP